MKLHLVVISLLVFSLPGQAFTPVVKKLGKSSRPAHFTEAVFECDGDCEANNPFQGLMEIALIEGVGEIDDFKHNSLRKQKYPHRAHCKFSIRRNDGHIQTSTGFWAGDWHFQITAHALYELVDDPNIPPERLDLANAFVSCDVPFGSGFRTEKTFIANLADSNPSVEWNWNGYEWVVVDNKDALRLIMDKDLGREVGSIAISDKNGNVTGGNKGSLNAIYGTEIFCDADSNPIRDHLIEYSVNRRVTRNSTWLLADEDKKYYRSLCLTGFSNDHNGKYVSASKCGLVGMNDFNTPLHHCPASNTGMISGGVGGYQQPDGTYVAVIVQTGDYGSMGAAPMEERRYGDAINFSTFANVPGDAPPNRSVVAEADSN